VTPIHFFHSSVTFHDDDANCIIDDASGHCELF